MLNYERVIAGLVHGCAESGKRLAQEAAMAGDNSNLKLCFKQATRDQNGDLIFVPDYQEPPTGFELATAEPLRGSVPYDSYFTWVRERVSRLPILAATA